MSMQKQEMLGSAIQSFNDCIYVELPSWSHWWQTFMIAWRWNPWPLIQLCNEVDILGYFGRLNLVQGRDSTKNRGGSMEHASSCSKGHEETIKYSGSGHPEGFHLSPFVGQKHILRNISKARRWFGKEFGPNTSQDEYKRFWSSFNC